jgi:cytochrome P450
MQQRGRGSALQVGGSEAGFDPELFSAPESARDPQSFYRVVRAAGAAVPAPYGGIEVVRRAEVEDVLHRPEVFSSAMEAVDLGQTVPLIPLQVDPPEHVKYRKLLDPIFAPKRMSVIEPDVARMVNDLVDGFIGEGACELTTALAEPLPSSVFLRLIGLPVSELPMFLRMKDGILRPQGADMDEAMASQRAAAAEVEAFFAQELADRRVNPRDDLISMFASAEVGGDRLTDEEILGICFLFLIAGLDTVTDSLECMFANLAQHPDRRRQIAADPSIIPSAVEELLRWETPVTTVARIAACDTEVGGCPVRKGEHVGVSIGSANTDEEAMPDAYVVDLTRHSKHLAFGGGVHRCLGSHLARLELRTTLREWHARIPDYELAPGTELTYGFGLRQIESLPLVWPA